MWFLSYIGSFFSFSAPRLEFRAEYTAWSGPAAWLQIGSEGQNIKVSLETTLPYSIVWKNSKCPAFISGGCYESSESLLVKGSSIHGTEIDICSERLIIGGDEWMDFEFAHHLVGHLRDPRNTMRGRDVAGMISLHWNSRTFSGMVLSIQDDPNFPQVTVKELAEGEEESSAIQFAPAVTDLPSGWIFGGGWTFKAGIFPGSFQQQETFLYDIGEPDIVIPQAEEDLFMRAFSFPESTARLISKDSKGRWGIPCESISTIRVWLQISPLGSVLISSRRLAVNPGGTSGTTCPLRIRSSINHLLPTVGRLLTRSVEKVVLDFKNSRLGIVPFPVDSPYVTNQSPLVNSLYLSSVQYFGDPELVRVSEGDLRLVLNRVQQGSTSSEEGYVLESLNPTTRNDGERRSDCWSLYRVWGNERDLTTTTGTLFTSIRIDSSARGSIQFRLENEEGKIPKARLKIQTTHRFVYICRESNAFKHVPVLPAPTFVGDEDTISDCPICLSSVSPGSLSQSLPGCIHVFHPDCINTWLGRDRGTACPVCRTAVNRVKIPIDSISV